jgi:hypothetical protein
MLDPQGNM